MLLAERMNNMKRKLTLTLIFVAMLSVLLAFQSGALSEDRPYTESDTIKIVDHVVYELNTIKNDTYYCVIDYFDTNEIAETATEINIASEIDGIPVGGKAPETLNNIQNYVHNEFMQATEA